MAAFVFSQPIGEQAELADLRWLLAASCEMPAVLNNGLIAWSKASWYLEECDSDRGGHRRSEVLAAGPEAESEPASRLLQETGDQTRQEQVRRNRENKVRSPL